MAMNVVDLIGSFITHAPLFRGGEDYVCESPFKFDNEYS